MSKMNIFNLTMAPINPPHDDGIKNMVHGMARRLGEYDFFMVSSSKSRAFCPEKNIFYYRSAFDKTGRHSMSLLQKFYVFLLVLFKIRRVDLFQFFITPQPHFSSVFRFLLKKTGKMSIQVVSSIHTLYRKNREKDIPGLFFGDYVITYSNFTRRKLEDMGVDNVVRIYPGIDVERFSAHAGEDHSLRGYVGKPPRIIYPGSYSILDEAYSFRDFCEIARRVLEKVPDARFVMACRLRTRRDMLLESAFKAATQGAGLKEHFEFLNTVEDMPSLLSGCDIGILPARGPMSGVLEVPLVLLEMAFLEKVVLYGNMPPLDEIHEKGLGVMVAEGTPAAYAEKVVEYLTEKDKAACAGKRSREIVEKFFTIDVMTGEYRKLYHRLQREA